MANGRPWTPEENAFIRDCVESAGMTNPQLVKAFGLQFGESRGRSAIEKQRAILGCTHTPTPAPGDIDVVESGDELCVTVRGGKAVTTVAQLIEAAGIDTSVWDTHSGEAKRYYVPMKVSGKPVIVEQPYTSVRFKRKLSDLFNVRPNVIRVTRPSRRKRPEDGGKLEALHTSDDHIPYHDPRVWDILYQIADDIPLGVVCHHGDLLDAEQISRFPKDPHARRSLAEEITIGATHLGTLKALTPHATRIFLQGNHEDRVRKTIWALADNRAAGELLTLPEVAEALKVENLLGIADDWKTYSYTGAGGPNHHLLFDRLILKHGDVVRRDSAATAKAECQKYSKSGMSGHTHRLGSYYHRDYNGVHAWFELGMAGMIREDYVAHADWQQGFAITTWSEDRSRYGVELVSINDGVCYFRGRRYEGRP